MVLVARREQALRNVAKFALDLGAPDVLVAPADISDPEQAKRVIEDTISHFGQRKLHKILHAFQSLTKRISGTCG
jgi:11beta/17beta-hydroxysteroid dehydrogenase